MALSAQSESASSALALVACGSDTAHLTLRVIWCLRLLRVSVETQGKTVFSYVSISTLEASAGARSCAWRGRPRAQACDEGRGQPRGRGGLRRTRPFPKGLRLGGDPFLGPTERFSVTGAATQALGGNTAVKGKGRSSWAGHLVTDEEASVGNEAKSLQDRQKEKPYTC